MSLLKKCLFTAICIVSTTALIAADPGKDKEPFDFGGKMTDEELRQTGLDQLDPEQMAQLNSWMRGYLGQKEENMRVEMVQIVEKQRVERRKTKERFFGFFNREDKLKEIAAEEVVESIESRIPGVIYGWRGNTVFHLENGQVWRQGKTGGTYAKKFTDPEIIISKRGESYWLQIKGSKASVQVSRVR